MPPNRRWLPQQLALELRSRGLRPRPPGAPGAPGAGFDDLPVALRAPGPPPPLIQRHNILAHRFGVVAGESVQLRSRPGPTPKSDAEFEAQPLMEGRCVVTCAAPHSPLGKAVPRLAAAPFWVWRILKVFKPGNKLPDNSRHVEQLDEDVFEAQLLAHRGRTGARAKLSPVWDVIPKAVFLRTPEEKAGPKARKRKRGHAKHLKPEVVHRPLTAFLRTANVLGGSFSLTTTGQMPVYVFDYVTRKLNALAP